MTYKYQSNAHVTRDSIAAATWEIKCATYNEIVMRSEKVPKLPTKYCLNLGDENSDFYNLRFMLK